MRDNLSRAELLAILSIDMYMVQPQYKKYMKKLHKKLSHNKWKIYYDGSTIVYASKNDKWTMRVYSTINSWLLINYTFNHKEKDNVTVWYNNEIEDLCI